MNPVTEMKLMGYETTTDPWDAVITFENELALYAGSEHCVVVIVVVAHCFCV